MEPRKIPTNKLIATEMAPTDKLILLPINNLLSKSLPNWSVPSIYLLSLILLSSTCEYNYKIGICISSPFTVIKYIVSSLNIGSPTIG